MEIDPCLHKKKISRINDTCNLFDIYYVNKPILQLKTPQID